MTAEPATLVACLTPPGQAALATLALRGPNAWQVARSLFRTLSGSPLPDEPEVGRFWVGRLGADLADEVVLAVKRAAPVPWLEVHAHGGLAVTRMLLDQLTARGLRACGWEEFLRQTTENPLRAAAAIALAHAPTVRTAAVLLDQHEGALAKAIKEILALLQRGDIPEATSRLEELAGWASLGRHLTTPWRVVVAGAPNVGKSSLVNALAGYQRSITDPTPGTTRDVVTVRLAIDGWPVELADTAGQRGPTWTLEEEGIRLALATMTQADLVLWLLDASAPPVWPDRPPPKVRLVINKIDLPAAWDLAQAGDTPRVSARGGEGLSELCTALSNWLVPEPPAPGAAVSFTNEMAQAVEEALGLLRAARVEHAVARLALDRS
jgi:tRNA modification GTPase